VEERETQHFLLSHIVPMALIWSSPHRTSSLLPTSQTHTGRSSSGIMFTAQSAWWPGWPTFFTL
jgi:hypothetical protein